MTPAGPRSSNVARQFIQTLFLTAISAIVLLTLAASMIGYYYLRQQTSEHLHSLAALTAMQAQAAVLFEDRQNATELLQAIPATGGVESAELRTENGDVLAVYSRAATGLGSSIARRLGGETVAHDVTVDGRRIGVLRLVGSNEPLVNAMTGLIVSDIVVATLLAILALLLGTRYAERVTRPLTQLRAVMRSVIDGGDYSQRAPASALAEAEDLRSEFNQLLAEITRRDQEIKQTNAALERMAFRDALTGLPNRAMFERALIETIRRDDAGTLRIGLLYLDLDDFKSINDRYGHDAGDRLLSALAERLQAWLPRGALAARIGGDEFVVLLAPFPEQGAETLIATLRASAEAAVDVGAHQLLPRVSIGWAVYPDTVDTVDDLARTADRSMYSDKRQRQGVLVDDA